MINRQEIKQRITPAIDTAIQIFSTAFRAPLFFILGCGYVEKDGKRIAFHDHGGGRRTRMGLVAGTEEPIDGTLVESISEGDKVPQAPASQGKVAIHKHSAVYKVGPYEYEYIDG